MEWKPRAVESYLKFVENTEPAHIHHLGCLLAVASALAGGGCWVQYGPLKKVLMNLYVGLIAPSGFRKSEAIGLAMKVFDALGNKQPLLVPKPLPDALSNVGLLQRCQGQEMIVRLEGGEEIVYTPMFICSSEFASFLRTRDRDMVAMLTNLFDGAVVGGVFEYQTQTGGTFSLRNPYAVLLMASTPEWLGERLPASAKQGGFMNRFLFFYSEEYRPKAFPQADPDIAEKMERVVEDLMPVVEAVGPVGWSQEAMEKFRKWYEERAVKELEWEEWQDVRGWVARKAIFTIKLAGLSALMDGRKVIEARDLDFAWWVIRESEGGVKLTFRLSGQNKDAWLEREIVRFVLERAQNNGGSVHASRICRQFASEASAKKIREVLQSLVETGLMKYDRRKDRVIPVMERAQNFIST